MSEEMQEQPKVGRRKKNETNGAAMTTKKKGRPKSAAPAIGTDWDLVLTGGKRGKLTLPPDMTTQDVEAVQMQVKHILELASLQADIGSV